MPTRQFALSTNVFDTAVERMVGIYDAGHRVVVSLSGGKDSGICVEICVLAARITGKLPVEVWTRDEEIMAPGTFEYMDRMRQRTDEIDLHWYIANQAITNVANREQPFFWSFDPYVDPDLWVRQPPPYAEYIYSENPSELSLSMMATTDRFPPPPEKKTYSVIGLRVQESRNRKLGIYSSKSFTTWFPAKGGTYNAFPIYDWSEKDVWLAYKTMNWDWNKAYDVQWRVGLSSNQLRIGPPTLNMWAIQQFSVIWRAWPEWSERVFRRLPGTRAAAMYGVRAIQPQRWPGETWEQVFQRECIDQAPWWIAERSIALRDRILNMHKAKFTVPLPETRAAAIGSPLGSWKKLTQVCYTGDPFCLHSKGAQPYVNVNAFRHGPPQPGSIYNEPRMSS